MPFAAGVKFRLDAFSKYYDPCDVTLAVDDFCIVHDRDLNVDRIGVVAAIEGRAHVQMGHLPKVLRRATAVEVEKWYERRLREKELMDAARDRSSDLNLDIKISEVTLLDEDRKALIHFTSEKRVDFRELVRDLSARFRARVEMWQVGARKEAGMKHGYGICGNPLCCGNWLKEYPSISMRHARDQDIIQPPSKLSGPCNRLRCCLRYEHEMYVELRTGAPATGCQGCSSGGACGVVIDRNLLKQEVTLRSEGGATSVVPFKEFTATGGRAREEPPRAIQPEPPEDAPVDDAPVADEPGAAAPSAQEAPRRRDRGRGRRRRGSRKDSN